MRSPWFLPKRRSSVDTGLASNEDYAVTNNNVCVYLRFHSNLIFLRRKKQVNSTNLKCVVAFGHYFFTKVNSSVASFSLNSWTNFTLYLKDIFVYNKLNIVWQTLLSRATCRVQTWELSMTVQTLSFSSVDFCKFLTCPEVPNFE